MKKFESLGRQLSREEQKAINGGFFNVYNVVARCSPSNSVVAGCGANCQDAYAQCDSACGYLGESVGYYGPCTSDPACL